jgi:hypothetical protein
VTIFYDSFYWAQIDLLLGAMGGVLSTRVTAIARGSDALAEAWRPRALLAWMRRPAPAPRMRGGALG